MLKEKVILFGASRLGEVAKFLLSGTYDIVAFCDNSPNKWGKEFCGINVISPKELKSDQYSDIKLIITSQYYVEINQQLKESQIENVAVFSSNFSSNIESVDEKIVKEIKAEERRKVREKETEIREKVSIEKEKKEAQEIEYLKKVIKKDTDNISTLNLHMMFDNFYTKSFIEFINENFDGTKHKFIIMVNSFREIKYINEISYYENVEICYVDGKYTGLIFQNYVNKAKKLFIHYLTEDVCKLLNDFDIPESCELSWILWGADLYSTIDRELYEEKTKEFIKVNLKDGLNFLSYKSKGISEYLKQAISKMNYILTNCEGDYRILKDNFETKALRQEFIYPSPVDFEKLDQINDENIHIDERYNFKKRYKHVIQLGNSGDPSNNHVDILYMLKETVEQDFCVICPLSYGNSEYVEKLIIFGKELLGDKFIPLTEFLSSHIYYSILKQVDIAIMNHRRQQAVGNILLLCYLNKQIFINDNNPFIDELTKMNIPVYHVQDVLNMEFQGLSKSNNSDKIRSYYDKRKLISLWEKLFFDNSKEVYNNIK